MTQFRDISLIELILEASAADRVKTWKQYLLSKGIPKEIVEPLYGWKAIDPLIKNNELYFVCNFKGAMYGIESGNLMNCSKVTNQDGTMNKQVHMPENEPFLATSLRPDTDKGYCLSQSLQGHHQQILFTLDVSKLKSICVPGKPVPYQMFNLPGQKVNREDQELNKKILKYLNEPNHPEHSVDDVLEYEVRLYNTRTKRIPLSCVKRICVWMGNSKETSDYVVSQLLKTYGKDKVILYRGNRFKINTNPGNPKLVITDGQIGKLAACIHAAVESFTGIQKVRREQKYLQDVKKFLQAEYYNGDARVRTFESYWEREKNVEFENPEKAWKFYVGEVEQTSRQLLPGEIKEFLLKTIKRQSEDVRVSPIRKSEGEYIYSVSNLQPGTRISWKENNRKVEGILQKVSNRWILKSPGQEIEFSSDDRLKRFLLKASAKKL